MKRQAITAAILALLVTLLGGWNVKVRAEGEQSVVQEELTGVYQFGDIPSGENELAACSDDQNVGYTEGVQEYLYQQMKMRSGAIDVSSYRIKSENLRDLVSRVLNDHPDLYFVEREWSATLDGDFVRSITMRYNSQYDDAAFAREANLALAVVKSGMSDLEKIIALHDYLAVNCRYADEFVDNVYSAYGALVDHTAVCQGYALAYQYLLNRAGVECYMVSSDAMNHAWNLVVLDGQYYHVDVTWDDPTEDLTGRACHEYMLKSDTEIKGHYDWVMANGPGDQQNYEATSPLYDNAFWNDSDAPMVIQGADCYYIAERGIMRASLSNINDAGTLIEDIGEWPVWESGYIYTKKYSGLFENGNRLYYNDRGAIYSIALDGSDRRTEFTADTTNAISMAVRYARGKCCMN